MVYGPSTKYHRRWKAWILLERMDTSALTTAPGPALTGSPPPKSGPTPLVGFYTAWTHGGHASTTANADQTEARILRSSARQAAASILHFLPGLICGGRKLIHVLQK
jgi:hypothetical protein